MSSTVISSSCFSIEPIDNQHHVLNIHFCDQDGKELSKTSFCFQQLHQPNVEHVYDVFTKNGICSQSSLKKLMLKIFDEEDLDIGEKVSLKLGHSFDQCGPKVCVFDFKHIKYGYAKEAIQAIAGSEEMVLSFLKEQKALKLSETAQKIQALFKEKLPLDFIILEGKLKVDLLEKGGFTADQKGYFNSTQGSKEFCQCAEFFMNGFKFGLEVTVFPTQEYVKPISAKYPVLPVCSLSKVFYPPIYKTIYAADGEFAKILGSVFSVTGEIDPHSKIVTLQMEKKA